VKTYVTAAAFIALAVPASAQTFPVPPAKITDAGVWRPTAPPPYPRPDVKWPALPKAADKETKR